MNLFEYIFLVMIAGGIISAGWGVLWFILSGLFALAIAYAIMCFATGMDREGALCVVVAFALLGVIYAGSRFSEIVGWIKDRKETRHYKRIFRNPSDKLKQSLDKIKEL